MPVALVNASRVGRFWVLSSTSMYSGQLDQLMIFSLSDMSCAALADGADEPDAVGFLPFEPHAARAVTPSPAAPIMSVRRETRPRARAAVRAVGVGSFMGVSPAGRCGGEARGSAWWWM